MKRISGGQTSLGADCHAPIRSRRRSSGGGERQELSQSDQPADRDFESQPAASPRTNRTSRTSPPGRLRDDDSDGTFRSIVRHGPPRGRRLLLARALSIELAQPTLDRPPRDARDPRDRRDAPTPMRTRLRRAPPPPRTLIKRAAHRLPPHRDRALIDHITRFNNRPPI